METRFRWRGKEVTRIEALSDAVFAFAVTLLVVSLEVPKTFRELYHMMQGFFAFAISFTILMQVWQAQNRFFRRYNLQDLWTITLNAALLFVVLFFVYPLKFLFGTLMGEFLGAHNTVTLADGVKEAIIGPGEIKPLMFIYHAGFVAIYAILTALYYHAWRKRDALELTEGEMLMTKSGLGANGGNLCVGLFSAMLTAVLPEHLVGFSGMSYGLIGVVQTVNAMHWSRLHRATVS
jgi:hypothetical protein